MDVESLHSLLIEAGLEAADVLRENFENLEMHEIVGIASPRDVTRRVDLISENLIVDKLKEERVEAIVIAEEQGRIVLSKNPEYLVLLDPLDGSNNYVSGIPYYSISIAYTKYRTNVKMEDLIGGIVVDVPSKKCYHALRGRGAYLGASKLTKYKPPGIPMILGYLNSEAYIVFYRLESERGVLKLRSLGSASLDLVYVAMGRAEVFADLRAKLRTVDIGGGYVVLREMGGRVYDGKGEYLNPEISKVEKVPSIVAFSDEESEKNFWRILELFREVSGEKRY